MSQLDPGCWSVHILVPWALRTHVKAPLDGSRFAVLDDGREIVSEWSDDSISSIITALAQLGCIAVKRHKIFMENIEEKVEVVKNEICGEMENGIFGVVLNMCDGLDEDYWPGYAVLLALEKRGLPFTGADARFFRLDTIKIDMKRELTATRAPTPKYLDLTFEPVNEEEKQALIIKIGSMRMPVIVKPSPSGSSRGITGKSVTSDPQEVLELAATLRKHFSGAYIEEFVSGREFTVLVSGSPQTGIKTYECIERCFNPRLKEHERFLSFDLKWNEWGADAKAGQSYWNELAKPDVQGPVQAAAREVFERIDGNGYARMDVRMDHTGKVFVLDVNANCSLDYAEDSAMGMILRGTNVPFTEWIRGMIDFAFSRDAALPLEKRSSVTDSKMGLIENYEKEIQV